MICRIYVILCLLLLGACSGHTPDGRLTRVAGMVSESPGDALSALDSIDRGSLSSADRHYHDLLTIKANDKAYNQHSSDSLILDVIDYYSSHRSTGLYPEALYYGGRVYNDLGDYPTALYYYQKSLDNINDEDIASLHLKGNVTSQLGRQLNDLRLYSQSIPYLETAIHIDSILCDTFSLAYDNQLLGAIYLHQDSLDLASEYFGIARTWAYYLTEKDVAHIQMYDAVVALRKGNISSAISLIRDIPDKVDSLQRNVALAYSSDIYKAAGKYDSAYIFADSLIHSSDDNNLISGYDNLFSPELYSYIPYDSLLTYITGFHYVLEDNCDKMESEQISDQISRYNYTLHLRQRQKVESAKQRITVISLVLGMVSLILFSAVLIILYRRRGLLLKLNSTLLQLKSIQDLKGTNALRATSRDDVTLDNFSLVDSDNVSELKEQLKAQLKQLTEQQYDLPPISPAILNSDVYRQLKLNAANGKVIPEGSPVWDDLESVVLSSYPTFNDNLRLLVGGILKRPDYHAVLLIKCGIPASEMSTLLGRTKGTISYRRKHVCEIILGEKINPTLIDTLIRCI